MRLIHHSVTPLAFDPTWTYDQAEVRGYGKPRGIWLSDEDDHGWRSWCEGEEWNLAALECETEFTLTPDANVLVIDSLDALEAFDAEYATGDRYLRAIDWKPVVERYDGIIITPYQWERRLDMMWYYGWDCASGCIWNLSAIAPSAPALTQDRMAT